MEMGATGMTPHIDLVLEAANKLPPLDVVRQSVLAELAATDISFAKLARLIERDPVLTAHVLSHANSVLFPTKVRVNSVQRALTTLGSENVRRLAVRKTGAELWKSAPLPGHFRRAQFNQHASTTATLAGLLTRRLGAQQSESLMLAALMHDISKLLLAVADPEACRKAGPGLRWRREFEEEATARHAELSAAVLERWNLPQEAQEIVALHHRAPDPASPPAAPDILRVADDYSISCLESPGAAAPEHLLAELGLAHQAAAIHAEFTGAHGRP